MALLFMLKRANVRAVRGSSKLDAELLRSHVIARNVEKLSDRYLSGIPWTSHHYMDVIFATL